MRSSLLLLAASAASAAVLPRLSTNFPASAFPGFKTITLEEAKAGKNTPDGLERNVTGTSINAPQTGSTAQTADEAACSANPNIRYEWRDYPTAERQAFIGAIKCLMGKPASGNFAPATNRYEDLVRVHQMYMPNVHNNAKFLLWHRYYLWTFEMVLRDECGFTGTFPWWDETLDAGNFHSNDMFTSPDYFGELTGPDSNGNPVCVTTGAFAGLTCNIGPGSSETPHCLSRAGNATLTANCNSDFVNTCNSRTDYADMEPCMEYGPHAYGHDGIGGVMADVAASPSDPIFWMHHTFVDHSFRIWQNADPSRTTTIDGVDHWGNPLTLDTVVNVAGIYPDVTIGQILNTMGGGTIGGKPWCYKYNY